MMRPRADFRSPAGSQSLRRRLNSSGAPARPPVRAGGRRCRRWTPGHAPSVVIGCTRTAARRYRFDYEEQDHVELLELLKGLPCQVMLSGYPSALYDGLLEGWRSLEVQVMNQGGVRTEKLWFNFTVDRVHWASYAGKNFTHRQQIKRKSANWARRYEALPQAQRLAVLAAMMAVEVQENSHP